MVLCNLQQPTPFFSFYPNFLSFTRLWSSRDLHNACTLFSLLWLFIFYFVIYCSFHTPTPPLST